MRIYYFLEMKIIELKYGRFFDKIVLIQNYSLNKHNNEVIALSLNQSESQLVSCADGKKQKSFGKEENKIIINHFIFKQLIQDYGLKAKFIKGNQFIWIYGGKAIDKCNVFKLKEGIFQENQEKTIQLITNNQILNEFHFPIIYNKEKNLIIVRHKTQIYLIREMNDGKFKIVDQLNCDTYPVYGTITNNGQYLVYLDDNKIGYSTYELQNK
ncbi:unnamed protein product [Paramecium pentaurelia]|uniref:Uncharacterized protein n=1 Tax=Paramecium pentaurelia TaxID=43138 RepID=A0A8S1XBW7_9CILI|nr:unnamed protein product [Paramecium pentaurelia]